MTELRWFTAGESHGRALTMVVEGLPAGLEVTEEMIRADLARRQSGYGRGKRQQIETDFAQITAGVRHGKTIGSPVAMWMTNADHDNANWQVRMSVAPVDQEVDSVTLLRPGHADLAGTQKYGFDDVRPILERSSARETAGRVAVGAVARALLREIGVTIHSHTLSVGPVRAHPAEPIDWATVEASPVHSADPTVEAAMIAEIDAAREAFDTIGGVFEVRASGLPIGLGSHVHWDRRLDGRIAQAFLSINAVKGVEIGDAFENATLRGSLVQDVILPRQRWDGRPCDGRPRHCGPPTSSSTGRARSSPVRRPWNASPYHDAPPTLL